MITTNPFLRQDDLYGRLENTTQGSNSTSSSDNVCIENKKLQLIMKKLTSISDSIISDSSLTFSNFTNDQLEPEKLGNQPIPDESIPDDKINEANATLHIIECKDNGAKHIILESRSSPTNFPIVKYAIDAVPFTKLLAPAKPVIQDIAKKKGISPPQMDWNRYHRLATIHSFLDRLESDHPSICTTETIGKSLEGRELKILKISNTNTSNACVWIDAGIHAREWIAPAVATYIANHIATNINSLPESVTNKDWYFLPVVNPDGYEHSHTVDRMWRKNRAWHRGMCVGVDLNRNFSFGWGGKGSSDIPTKAFYRGPGPFSEPESTAIKDMLVNAGLSFQVYITLHSYGQVIIFPYAFKDELCADYVRLLEGATVMSKAIHKASGNTYKVGISRDVMYGAAGTSYDFSYGEGGIPFCYLIELRSKQHKFMVPKEEIEETGNEILNCVKALMDFIDNRPEKLTQ